MNHHRRPDIHSDPAFVHAAFPCAEPAGQRDALFSRLDGQTVRARAGDWRTEVVSIVVEHGATWVQVALSTDPSTSVVLRMTDVWQSDLALEALRQWSNLPEDRRPTWVEVGLQAQ